MPADRTKGFTDGLMSSNLSNAKRTHMQNTADGMDVKESKEKYTFSGDGESKKDEVSNKLPEENLITRTPNSSKFNVELVEKITESLLIERLHDISYDAMKCKQLSQELASEIMERLKMLKIRHYKLVAVVSIGSINERPGMQFGSRCLWHHKTDKFASVKFTNGSLFAVAMVYGLYFE